MACFSPLHAYRGKVGSSGKQSIVWRPPVDVGGPGSSKDNRISLPCGRCIGCRLEKSRQWAIRCVNEASLHSENCFLTLTYRNEDLPENKSLDKRHFQLFMKRLRKEFSDKRIRYFHCGEYGISCKNCGLSFNLCQRVGCGVFVEGLGRPHYHCLVFGLVFGDAVATSSNRGFTLFESPTLDRIWGKGRCVIGPVNFETAAYVARYVMKKVTNKETVVDGKGVIHESQDVHYEGKSPEYTTCSRRPGIGRGWYDRYKDETYRGDSVIVRALEVKPPKYYDRCLEVDDPVLFKKVKFRREIKALTKAADNDSVRLRDKEIITESRVKQLKRHEEEM